MKQLIRHILREHTREIDEQDRKLYQDWSDEELEKSAATFKTLKDYSKTSGSGYKTAKGKGKDFFDRITIHMPRVKIWSYDEAKQEAEKYSTFADFQKNSTAFGQSYKNGWTNDFKKFLKLRKGEWEKYTKEMVIADVAKCHNKVEFRDKFPQAYKAARENGWYDEVTEPLVNVIDDRTRLIYAYEFPDKSVYVGLTVNEKRRKSGHLNIEDIESPVAQHIINTGMEPQYKVIVKDLTPKEAQESEGCTEEKYRLKGWKILNKYKTGSLGACRRFWTKEMAQKESEKYETRGEFKKGSKSAYQAAQKYGWLGDLTKNMGRADRVVWNYDKTKEFAKQFNSRAQMKYASQSAYDRARTQGWLDDFFSPMTDDEKIVELYNKARDESKKYKNRQDFHSGSPSLYNHARINNWLDELIPKSDRTYNQSDNTDFIRKAKSIHGDRYDYSLIDYKNSNTNIIVNCRDHGPFPITPTNHLTGGGCPICANINRGNARRSNKNDFVDKAKKIFGDEYDYSLVNYKNNSTPVSIICSKHGLFPKSPQNHLKGQGCPKCKEETNYRGSSQRKNNI